MALCGLSLGNITLVPRRAAARRVTLLLVIEVGYMPPRCGGIFQLGVAHHIVVFFRFSGAVGPKLRRCYSNLGVPGVTAEFKTFVVPVLVALVVLDSSALPRDGTVLVEFRVRDLHF
jgi:hypothetical protein